LPNAFQTGERKVVPACLIYGRAAGLVLMIHRHGRNEKGAADTHLGKWNGLGGKFEPDESPREAARREFLEETGFDLRLEDLLPVGVLQFPNFRAAAREDWIVYVFEARMPSCRPVSGLLKDTREGALHWVPEGDLLSLNLWEGDREFLPLVAARKPFIGTFWYEDGRLVRSWLQSLLS